MVKQGFDPFRFQDERLSTFGLIKPPGGGGGVTPLQEANRDVSLDGVAFSRLE